MSNYSRGRAFEYRVRDKLAKLGYTVFRAAGSKGPVDLIAFHEVEEPMFVQARGGQRGMSQKEKGALVEMACRLQAAPVEAKRGLVLTDLRDGLEYD